MPYSNPYSTSLPGIRESLSDTIVANIQASLTDLNTALNRDSRSPMTWTSAQVILGDPETVTTSLICVVGGGKQDATDVEELPEHRMMPRTDGGGMAYLFHTNIYVYIHPDEMRADSPLTAVQYREVARARIVDHLRKRVFDSKQYATMTLTSQEYTSGTTYDTVGDCRLKQIALGVTPKGPDGRILMYSAHLMHTCAIF